MMVIDVPAKINLFLIYKGLRDDGYAEIVTGIQAIDIFDRLIFESSDKDLEFICSLQELNNEKNLVYRAAFLFKNRFGFKKGVRIVLEKRIPVEAGLGGGSADAAFTLLGLAQFFDYTDLSRNELIELGSLLGSDIPFFFTSGQAIARGRGEKVEEVVFPANYSICIVKPPFGIPTSWAYELLKKSLTPRSQSINLIQLSTETFLNELEKLGNDFEYVIFQHYPIYYDLKKVLKKYGADIVRLTGSGSGIYGLFRDDKSALTAVENMKNEGYEVYLAHPLVLNKT